MEGGVMHLTKCEKVSGAKPWKLAHSQALWASAMGTRLSIYEYTKATNMLLPPGTTPDPNVVNDDAPQELWKYDLLEVAGEEKLKALVEEIKAMAHSNIVSVPFDDLSSR